MMPKLACSAFFALMLLVIFGVREVVAERSLEGPTYTLDKTDGAIEVRSYQPYLVAQVTVKGDRPQAANQGFEILAGYIFGKNRSRKAPRQAEKIAMTSPVTQEPQGQGSWKVRFMMPQTQTLETLPVAEDERIRFLHNPAERYLVLRFSGGWSEDNLSQHRKQLQQYAASHQLEVSGEPFYAFYNAPFVPPPLRRNEVLLRLP